MSLKTVLKVKLHYKERVFISEYFFAAVLTQKGRV